MALSGKRPLFQSGSTWNSVGGPCPFLPCLRDTINALASSAVSFPSPSESAVGKRCNQLINWVSDWGSAEEIIRRKQVHRLIVFMIWSFLEDRIITNAASFRLSCVMISPIVFCFLRIFGCLKKHGIFNVSYGNIVFCTVAPTLSEIAQLFFFGANKHFLGLKILSPAGFITPMVITD